MNERTRFAIGAGLGGLVLSELLSREGAKVHLYEQAQQFQRLAALSAHLAPEYPGESPVDPA